ncbi:MAG: isoprenylcysteine carboxylmethyltransferase family protein [Pseudomonadales bacterium]
MHLLLKNLLFTVLVPGTDAVYLPCRLSSLDKARAATAASIATGSALIALGLLLYIACLWPFATLGRGTPAPIDPPKQLVVAGPYRFVRNPMYLAVLCVIAGQAVWHLSGTLAIYGAGVTAMFCLFVQGYEERTLCRLFGDDYRAYCARVPRWLPRFPSARR